MPLPDKYECSQTVRRANTQCDTLQERFLLPGFQNDQYFNSDPFFHRLLEPTDWKHTHKSNFHNSVWHKTHVTSEGVCVCFVVSTLENIETGVKSVVQTSLLFHLSESPGKHAAEQRSSFISQKRDQYSLLIKLKIWTLTVEHCSLQAQKVKKLQHWEKQNIIKWYPTLKLHYSLYNLPTHCKVHH